jgi:CRP/FNR family transcriptional regulator
MKTNYPLTRNQVFSQLDKAELEKLATTAQTQNFQNGAWIVHHGDVWAHLFFIQKGQVTAIKESPEGRSLTLSTFNVGEIFWGLAFFIENAPMPAALKATADSELLLWHRDDIMQLIMSNGKFSWELSRLTIRRVQFASEIVEQLAFQPLAQRVARLLLDEYPANQIVVPRHLTLDEMASRVGTTREIVCRILYKFAEQGAIQIDRTEFTFLDRSVLEEQLRHR